MAKALHPPGTFRDLLTYLRVFQAHVGWRMYLVGALTLVGTLAEGFGIVMVLPVLESLSVDDRAVPTPLRSDGSGASQALGRLLDRMGIVSAPALLAIIGAAFLLKGVASFGAKGYMEYLRGRFLRSDQRRLFRAYSQMDYVYYARRNTGHFVNVITAQLTGFYSAFGYFVTVFAGVVTATTYFLLAMFVAWRFGVAALCVGLLFLFLFRWLNGRVRTLSRNAAKEQGRLSARLIQFLHAFKYLTATSGATHLQKGFTESVERLRGYQLRQDMATAFTDATREPLAVFFVIGIVLVQISVLGQPLAPIMVAIVLFNRGLNSMLDIQGSLQKTFGLIGSAEVVRREFEDQAQHREPDGTREIGPLDRSIEFRDVSFAYGPDAGDALRGISLTIPARTTVAVVGESGAGKSTLIDMLSLLLKPHTGQVLIDDVPARDVALASWRRQIGYVSQETVVFDDTVANNICLWEGEVASAPDLLARVQDAARRANLDAFIESLPEGYLTRVGDRGVRLSGGQRQRLFIARELFKHPRLLILDEATSALDSESERAIQSSIDALRGHMTLVIIAHRLSTIRNVDQVLVLAQGRLVEQGTYEALSRGPGSKFAAMIALQSLLPDRTERQGALAWDTDSSEPPYAVPPAVD